MLPQLAKIIGLDPLGFMPGREARDNTVKAINILHLATLHRVEVFLLSMDAEKAFNRVAWELHASYYFPNRVLF